MELTFTELLDKIISPEQSVDNEFVTDVVTKDTYASKSNRSNIDYGDIQFDSEFVNQEFFQQIQNKLRSLGANEDQSINTPVDYKRRFKSVKDVYGNNQPKSINRTIVLPTNI